jgi:[ribosomal protein S5]-alanine N-acetyltransferase
MNFTIYLRALRIEDAEFINDLRSIPEMEDMLVGVKRFVSFEREKEWVKSLIMNDDPTKMYFAICKEGNSSIIGYTSISDIDYRNGKCFWSGIKLHPSYSGKGYGFQAELLILKYCFENLRIVRCLAMGLEEHEVALNYMEKAGFVREGLMRKYTFKNGEYKDVWMLSMIDDDYKMVKEKYEL